MDRIKQFWNEAPKAVRLFLAGVVIILVVFVADKAFGQQQNCGPREGVVARLAERYGETLQSRGVTNGGQAVMEIFANLDTGTFTVAMSSAQGVSCLVAAGEGFQHMDAKLEPSGLRL